MNAAGLTVISANGLREVIKDTKADYEATAGRKLDVSIVETGEIRRRVLAGEAYDAIMVPRAVADAFAQAGKLAPGGAVPLIRIGFGLAVAANKPKPDVGTPEALKRTLLAARTVLITDPRNGGISGVHFMEVLNALGIAEAMKEKLKPAPGNAIHAARVAAGEADLAVQAEHEIRSVPDAAFLPYPPAFDRPMVMVGVVGAACRDPKAARHYLDFLAGPAAAAAYRAHHLTRA